MHIISRKKLKEFYESPEGRASEDALERWYKHVKRATWQTDADIKRDFGSADYVHGGYVFNICGNHFRLAVVVRFHKQKIFIVWVGTHKEYDKQNIKELLKEYDL